MIRKAKNQDLDAVEKMYEEIITAPPLPDSSVGWILGVYPTRKTAEDALGREDLFVLEDEGRVVASAIINQVQVPSYREADWAYAAEDSEVMVLHTLCVFPTESKRVTADSLSHFMRTMPGNMVAPLFGWTQTRKITARAKCTHGSAIMRQALLHAIFRESRT